MSEHQEPNVLPAKCWTVADLRIDVGQQRVQRGDEAISLPKLSFDLLVVLLQEAPDYVSSETLMARVWTGLVVSPETVTQRVKLLRDALGDDPRQPRYIEGLRGRGYRFLVLPQVVASPAATIAALEASPDDTAAPPDTRSQEPAPGRHRGRRTAAVMAAIGMAAAAALGYGILRGRPADEPSSPRQLAIQPLASVGGGPAEEPLAVAVREALRSRLASVRGLTLLSGEGPAGLEVRGSVQQSTDRLRVSVHLVDVRADQQLWSRQLERPLADSLRLQDEVATLVAQAVEAQLANVEPARPRVPRSAVPEANIVFLQGRSLLGRQTVAGADAAAAAFESAVRHDPRFVAAQAALYDARMQASALRKEPLAAARRRHQPLLDRAFALDPESGPARIARAIWSDGPDAGKEAEFRAALAADPGNTRGLIAYAQLSGRQGRAAEAQRLLERAVWIEPRSSVAHFELAQRNFEAVGAAIEQQTLKVLEIDPQFYPALQRYAKYQWMQHGEIARALTLIGQAIAQDPENPWGRHTAVAFLLDIGRLDEAERVAAATPASAASTRALIALYRGDTRAAALAARDPQSHVFARPERWLVATALRDDALAGGDVAAAIAVIQARFGLADEGPWKLLPGNFREGFAVAHLLMARGDPVLGRRRLDEVVAWIDANPVYGPVYNLRTRAQALMLTGQTDAALAMLAESFAQHDYTHWWYTFRHDPVWQPLRNDARFTALSSQVVNHIQREARMAPVMP